MTCITAFIRPISLSKSVSLTRIQYNWSACPRSQRLFGIVDDKIQYSFGIIADIQYADADDSYNFQMTKIRRYRQSLDIFRQAVREWSKHDARIQDVVVLGDMIDARAAADKNQLVCLSRLQQICDESTNLRFHFTIGNHCHYNFKRNEIYDNFISRNTIETQKHNTNQLISINSLEPLHYSWSPHPGWRFVFLDSYDVSLIGYSTEDNQLLAKALLNDNNPNDLTKSGTWFDNLPFDKSRWVPYNGMISDEQLEWLEKTLSDSVKMNERVIIFCHQPVYSPLRPNSLVWNAEVVMNMLHRSGNVCLWIAGHDHGGNYCRDAFGIHHLIPPVSLYIF